MRFSLSLALIFIAAFAGCTTNASQTQINQKIAEVPKQITPTPRLTQNDSNYNSIPQNPAERLDNWLPPDVRRELEQAESFEFLSVSPGIDFSKQKPNVETISVGRIWKFAVVGKTKITDSVVRKEIINALYQGVSEGQARNSCFSPRHAIRTLNKGKKVELLICFQCLNFKGTAFNKEVGGSISKSPQELFNRILTDAGVQLGQ